MKAGFVALIGRSNVGKSTLLNALVGTKVAITSSKPQTTRHQIRGILHDPRGQIVFVDTPGIFEQSRGPLTAHLNKTAKAATDGVDAIVYVVDPSRAVGNEEHIVLRVLKGASAPVILCINKTDLRDQPFLSEFEELGRPFAAVLQVSALRHRGLKPLVDAIFERLPEGEPLYPEFQFTDMEHRFWVAELIREKIFIQMGAEIPYHASVEVQSIEDKPDAVPPIRVITATILTDNPRHKQMLIGKGGRKIKEIGWSARRELEAVLGIKIYLDLTVEVDDRWMDRLGATLAM